MKVRIFWILGLIACMGSCGEKEYLDDLYVDPVASFSIDKTHYEVLESVKFTNTGKGQNFVVYPGDEGHVYGVAGNEGYATAADGTFSYSYQEPGVYDVVWVASSVNSKGKVEFATKSVQIEVTATNGGLDYFCIYNIYKMPEYPGSVYYSASGKFISADTIMCPILFACWRDAKVNSIKAPIQLISFELASSFSKFYWYDRSMGEDREVVSGATTSRFINFMENDKLAIQDFKVKTASGYVADYFVAPVMIPQFTSFSIDGIKGTIERDIAYYDVYNVSIKLETGIDISALKPEFEVMNNDPNLLDGTNVQVSAGGTVQQSGVSVVDFSNGPVEYKITYRMLGQDNEKLVQTSRMIINVKQ